MNSRRISSDLVLLKIDASRSNLRVGDPVSPATIVGQDFESTAELKAGIHGRVESISFSPEDHALLVLIREERGGAAKEEEELESVAFKIEASRCRVRIGDRVSPGTVVGEDYETGETVMAGVEGRVKAVDFIPQDHAFVVEIQPSA
jgi:hypothetical protein